MAEFTGTFETGINGNTVSAGDPGSATAWNTISTDANGTLTYSNVQAYQTLACNMILSATPSTPYVDWNSTTLGSSLTDVWGRIYYWTSGLPNTAAFPVRGFDTGARAWEIFLDSLGHVNVRDNGGTTRGTGSVVISTSQFIRMEFHMISSTTAGFMEVKLFNNADSSTPSETITSTGAFSTLSRTDEIRFGENQTNNASRTLYMDNLLLNNTGYPGPFTIPSSMPGDNPPIGFLGRGAGW